MNTQASFQRHGFYQAGCPTDHVLSFRSASVGPPTELLGRLGSFQSPWQVMCGAFGASCGIALNDDQRCQGLVVLSSPHRAWVFHSENATWRNMAMDQYLLIPFLVG